MNINFLRSFFVNFITLSFIFIIIIISSLSALAQSKRGSPSAMPARGSSAVNYRILANYDYIMTSPSDLNTFSSGLSWTSTNTPTKFDTMNGYSLGVGYLMGAGFLGLEYGYGIQELPSTFIPPSSTVQYSLDYQTVYLLYDWVFNSSSKQSFELGAGVGYALKYQYHWLYKTGGTITEVIWQDNPIVFKVRAHYNYHFTNTFRLRLGATYELASSSNLKADSSNLGVVQGQTLRYSGGQNVKVDTSGLRLNAGLVLAF